MFIERELFRRMEYVMHEMCWDYQTLMRCIYGNAQGGDLTEAWVVKWLTRQQEHYIREMKLNCRNMDSKKFIERWMSAIDFRHACDKIGLTPRDIAEQAVRYRILGIELKKLEGEPISEG